MHRRRIKIISTEITQPRPRDVRLLPVQQFDSSVDRIIETAPALMDKLGMFIDGMKAKKADRGEDAQSQN